MANVKITELTAATALAGTDVLPIVDVGADATKKVSVSDLLRNLPDGTASAPALAFADDQNTGVLSPGDNSLAFATSGTQRLVIDSSGNCGIGDTSPSNELVVKSGGSPTIEINGQGRAASLTLGVTASESKLFEGSNNALAFGTNNTERLRIDNSGNVGVGVSSPTSVLDIRDTQTGAASEIKLFNLDQGNTTTQTSALVMTPDVRANGAKISVVKENADFSSSANKDVAITFAPVSNNTATERLRIDSLGRLLHGTTSSSAAASAIFEGNSSNAAGAGVIYLNRGTGSMSAGLEMGFIRFGDQDENTGALIEAEADGTWASNDYPGRILFSTTADGGSSPTERMRITSSGKVGIGTSSPTNVRLDIKEPVSSTAGTGHLGFSGGSTPLWVWRLSDSAADLYLDRYSGGWSTTPSLTIKRDTGNVGIGTTSPGDKLAVSDGSNITELSGYSLYFKSDSTGYIQAGPQGGSSGRLVFQTNTAERMRIDSSGRVGINNTSPGSQHFNDLVIGDGSANDAGLTIHTSTSGSGSIAFSDGTSGAARYDGYLQYDHYNQSFKVYTNGGNERMRIDSSGDVGIGTSSPATRLQIGDSTVNSGNVITLGKRVTSAQSNLPVIGHTSDGTASDLGLCATSSSGAIRFFTGNNSTGFGAGDNTERMRITSGGNVFIGSGIIGDSTNGPGEQLSGGGFLRLVNSTFNSSSTCFEVRTGTPTTSVRMVIRNDGDLENVNNRYGSYSDVRYKENIVDARSQWNDIKNIKIRNYNFTEESGFGTHTQIGVVAQELETVCPGLVTDSAKTDDDGNSTEDTHKTVAYSVLYVKAIKALQEAMDRIETLETKVAALEAQ